VSTAFAPVWLGLVGFVVWITALVSGKPVGRLVAYACAALTLLVGAYLALGWGIFGDAYFWWLDQTTANQAGMALIAFPIFVGPSMIIFGIMQLVATWIVLKGLK
jgi:hypothetical protein